LEGEVREETLRGNPASQFEEVVTRVFGVEVDTFLDFEDMDREDRGFAVAQTGFLG
jgi:hypothetical protein